MANPRLMVAHGARAIEINSVLRNTYLLLSATLAFAALCSGVAITLNVPYMGFLPYIIGFFALSWIVHRTANSSWGIVWTFVFAGFIGVAMAPIIAVYLYVNPMIVVQSLALTAATFVALSMYTIVKKADFSWLGQFITISFFVIIGIIVLWFFVDLSAFSLMISGFMIIVASALILYRTSQIVLGGERNYITATVDLFVSFYILFMNLMSLIGIFGGDE